MKKLLLLLLFCGIANAQVVTITDPYLKNDFISYGIDTNSDGEIQVSEALAVTTMVIEDVQVTDMSCIGAFSNLTDLTCSNTQTHSLDFSALTQLRNLTCINNYFIETLNISGLPNLEMAACNSSPFLTSIIRAGTNNLRSFYCAYDNLPSVPLDNLPLLVDFYCDYNQITSLDLSGAPNLINLSYQNNQISSIDLSPVPNLESLNGNSNSVVNLDLSGNTNLKKLYCSGNQLQTLNVQVLPHLEWLYCDNNQLQTLNVSGLSSLTYLLCNNNQLTGLNLAGASAIVGINCYDNLLPMLDLSEQTSLETVYCFNNQITTIFAKNGRDEGFTWYNNPLQYVCLDANQVQYYEYLYAEGVMVNSYCSFRPGGDYNTITGVIHFDADSNGCDSGDPVFGDVRVNLDDGTNVGSAFANDSGIYRLYVQEPNISLSAFLENPSYFTISPATATVNFSAIDNSTYIQDFCVVANGVHKDLEVTLHPTQNARPGFDARYSVVVKNKGNQTLSGNITLNFDDSIMDFVSAMPAVAGQTNGSLNWNYSGLIPFEVREMEVKFNLNSPMETPAVNLGDILHYSVSVTPADGDETPADNTFNLVQTVVGSSDPNDKHCLEGEVVNPSEIGNYLHYQINFENVGTAAAENIVVRDIIDESKFEINSVQIVGTSHPARTTISGNRVEFTFENVQLQPNEHGNVVFKIQTKNGLAIGDSVSNKADIFFDYNFPVETNTATSVFEVLKTTGYETDNSVSISPNPATDILHVKADSNISSISLFDVQGRVVAVHPSNDANVSCDISKFSKGVYFVKIITGDGMKIEKIIKK